MKRILAAGTAMLLSMGAAAHADTITVDDFNTLQTTTDTTANGSAVSTTGTYTLGGNAYTRTLIVNQTEHNSTDPLLASEARIGFGSLKLSNDSGANSIIDLNYDIDSIVDDVAGAASELMMSVIFADASLGIAFTIEGYLNGEFLGSQTFTGPGALEFDLPALAASGNELRLVFSGGTSFDSELGPITIEIGDGGQIPVPEPGALGLLGLGLASVAFARRRKAAA